MDDEYSNHLIELNPIIFYQHLIQIYQWQTLMMKDFDSPHRFCYCGSSSGRIISLFHHISRRTIFNNISFLSLLPPVTLPPPPPLLPSPVSIYSI
ncbi:hypothetical protein DERP_005312 [Dermatophagoides pteronyssinus]|uniref:Uncharacterized protein n=1 Tax=Dermatophagoides pteronyssinus TaxID=6956 RepID=A0ABQ8JN57_DERPT|nr:hypothetical protein DERP_005312 [Dermatophagoides pteronyssinus]